MSTALATGLLASTHHSRKARSTALDC